VMHPKAQRCFRERKLQAPEASSTSPFGARRGSDQ
jgi:hypothetical protein